MFSSYCSLHPASHSKLIDIMDAWDRPGTMWACFDFSEIISMSRLHVCVDLSFDPSGRLTDIDFLAGCTLFPGFPGRTKCPVAPVSDMAYCLII